MKKVKITYRVECNFGCKYFDGAVQARAYFRACKRKGHVVELWLIVTETTPQLFSSKQELLDFSTPKIPQQ